MWSHGFNCEFLCLLYVDGWTKDVQENKTNILSTHMREK